MATLPSPAPINLPTARSSATKPSSLLSFVRTNHRFLSKLSSPVFLDLRSHGGSRSVSSTSLNCLPSSSGKRGEENEEGEEVERALGMDGSIPGGSQEFVRRVSSRAYDIRRNLIQSIDSLSYDVLEKNPWREDAKPVYVLTQRDNHLWTMKTRRSRSEVERELGMLFSKGGSNKVTGFGTKARNSGIGFNMLVEDIRDGVLVFEDENDAVKYCDILQGGGQGCEGIAELEASSVFDICHKMKALAVLFRRGRTPPLPKSLERNLRARKRSLED
ncbi:plant/protein [Carex rostrata]